MPEKDEQAEDSSLAGRGKEAAGRDEAASLSEEARRAIQARVSPEGIVTILFTDIVESTRLRQRLGDDEAQKLFREHNRILRDQIEKHEGCEVKTYGDGFMVAFADVVAALGCATDIQRGIAEHNREHPGQELQVRIGMHCGRTIKDEEDFFGTAVVVAARTAELAKGGQILVSEMVRGLSGSPQGIRYVRYGRRRLKGLAGTYDIWSVPWQEVEVTGFARLWANPAFRLTAPILLLAAIGGGIAGGLVLSRAGGDGDQSATAEFQEFAVHSTLVGTSQIVSGDCVSEDLVFRGNPEGPITGDITGSMGGTFESILYAAGGCQSGLITANFTITDLDGNTLFGTSEGPRIIATLPGEEASASTTISALVISGGTGIYEGVTGGANCTTVTARTINPDRSIDSQSESDCTFKLTTVGAAGAAPEPLIVQMGASATEMTVFGSPMDLPNTVAIDILYRNTREQAQKGLSLRLPVPEGSEILAAARGEEQPVSAGERIWNLPTLPPGAVQRFEFTLQLLAAETLAVPLLVEIDGAGFERPVASDPITIIVVK